MANDHVEEMCTFDLKELQKFQASLESSDQGDVEAAGATRHFREAIKSLESRVVLVNPSQFEVIRKSVKQTDRHDARTLALFLSKDMLPESRLKDARRWSNARSLPCATALI